MYFIRFVYRNGLPSRLPCSEFEQCGRQKVCVRNIRTGAKATPLLLQHWLGYGQKEVKYHTIIWSNALSKCIPNFVPWFQVGGCTWIFDWPMDESFLSGLCVMFTPFCQIYRKTTHKQLSKRQTLMIKIKAQEYLFTQIYFILRLETIYKGQLVFDICT